MTLQLQAWELRSLPSTVCLCTKSEGSKKSSTKGSTKNKGDTLISTKPGEALKLTDEDLRKYLANKTLVTFPQRTKLPSLERESVFSSTRGLDKRLADEESSSSSSSDSDSSSDSEEEDNALKDTIKTKVSFPRRDPISSENATVKVKISEKHFPQDDSALEKPPYSTRITKSPVEQKGFYETTADDKLRPVLTNDTTKQRPTERHLRNVDLGMKTVKTQMPTEIASKQLGASFPEGTPSKLSRIPSVPQSVAQNPALLRQEDDAAKGLRDTEIQQRTATVVQEAALTDRVPVAKTTMEEAVIQEAEVQTEQQSTTQEAKPTVEPVEAKPTIETAQEVFDISTYKNLQHHTYTPFTFVDFDVQLSKFRLPQPSSGRQT
ncbi:NADH dehydrogenase [ubiquinone] flavoprotein 3, mitochondrial isoform X2 [Hemicordylus capensis]|uniref:NADH dehydrogenase [ubiquinone] flavoprotein 3, mitochondrial isoform X2 n=1 Tax=Hemicordylus capensis TaxID=884348 RepID=UPI0023047A73|nr:NADH dehydrogenase [ubiquinone] flavoprotein 3, mitochondrial isoform X2 [Hemicordylus capensis]